MKYVNWISISTAVVSLMVIGILTQGWNRACAEYSEFQTMKVEVQASREQRIQMQQTVKVLEKIASDVTSIKKSVMTVTGRMTIRNFSDVACVRINVAGRAAEYANKTRARVTNLSSLEMPSVVVKIEGTFRHADADYLGVLSKHAADLIDAVGNVNVRVELVEE